METGAFERLRDSATLLACHSGDENRSIVCHSWSPIQKAFKLAQSGLSLQARLE
jgi:hypothetical protein